MPRNGVPDNNAQDTDISSTAYARKCKAILDLHRELNEEGAGMLKMGFPKIAVIGGQSAGKSSLVEAVSGVKVPRDSGTCTRCPMECTMSSSAETWSCSISLSLRYDKDGNDLASPSNVAFAPLITNRSEVELWIRRAQAAILCPHRSASEFSAKSKGELKDALNPKSDPRVLEFSKNAVIINVKDPELTDLSFIDLPGLIQNADKTSTIDLVKNLVVSNIQEDDTLILITIPASDDMENQQAVRLAKEEDPHGERTVGVITKPDTLTKGSIGQQDRWKKILQGEDHKLRHGYYSVRLPDDAERAKGITRIESQRRASEFFDTVAPWKDILERRRLGIPNLVADISKLLVNLIERNLPKMKENIEKLLIECTSSLNSLPAPPINEPSTEILLRITKFCDDLKNTVSADSNKHVTQAHRSRYADFQDDIRATTPDFRPFAGTTIAYSRSQEKGISFSTEARDLMYIRDVISESIGWELPGHVPFEATKRLVLEYTSQWKEPAISCFEDIFESTMSFIEELLEEHFGDFKALKRYVNDLVQPILADFKAKCLQQLEAILTLETVPLFTLNTHYLESAEKKWITRYTWAREYPVLEYGTSQKYNGSSGYSLESDEFRDEILVMAKARAYFQVAYKRIIDYVPLTVEHGLKQPLASVIQQNLFSSVLQNGTSSQKLAELLHEDPVILKQRKYLEQRKITLLKIKRKLDDFNGLEIYHSDAHSEQLASEKLYYSPLNSLNLDLSQIDSTSQPDSAQPSTSTDVQRSESKKGKKGWKGFFGTT
ncbi:P-loop containing nucleoside triphosphate hydrolase protein [Cyathus striatus]|nr:P-loop containing nucleoside triphosphate hydrolase protein [Cyathus striatus]